MTYTLVERASRQRASVRFRDKKRAIVQQAKSVPCTDCGVSYPPYVMDFDHVRGLKTRAVSHMAMSGSVADLLAEIAKCEVVCSNCHRLRTMPVQGLRPHRG